MKRSFVKNIILLILIIAATFGGPALRANDRATEKQQEAVLKKADNCYKIQSYSLAATYYEIYLVNDENSNVTLVKLADCYWRMREYNEALRVYKLLYPAVTENATKQQQLRIGELYARFGQYEEASKWLKNVKGYQPKAETYNDKTKLEEMKKDSANWKLGFLDVNTVHREFSPFIAGDELFFSSNKPLNKKTKASGWDGDNYTRLWKVPIASLHNMTEDQIKATQPLKTVSKSKKSGSKTLAGVYEGADTKPHNSDAGNQNDQRYVSEKNSTAATLVDGLNGIKYNAGAISMDKKSHFYFSANYPKSENGINRIRLMEGIYTSSGITKKHALPFGNPKSYSVMHPAVNQDGTILVFSSDKPEGKGGCDLYYAKRSDVNQPWGELLTFKAKINTLGNEVFPSITQDNILYYSSDLPPGLGGLDIYRIPLKDAIDGTGETEHLSYPINSSADDFGWTQDSTGTKGYFASDRRNSNDNLYSFYYKVDGVTVNEVGEKGNKSVAAIKKSYIEGYVLDKVTLKPIKGATVFLLNKIDGKVTIAKTDESGKYNFIAPSGNDLVIKAIDNGYMNDCYALDATVILQKDDQVKKVPQDLLLGKYIIGKKWKLNNIHYDFNKFEIRPDARPILDSLVEILKTYPITAELGSHTDSRGSFGYNQKLSQHRADAAVAYLVEHGIDKSRISAKGYGETQLLNKCADGVRCTPAEHQANRRTEVKVTGYVLPSTDSVLVNPDNYSAGEEIDKSELPKNFFEICNEGLSQKLIDPTKPTESDKNSKIKSTNQVALSNKQSTAQTPGDKEYIAYETIAPGGRLALLARQYFGSRDFWCYIYQANKDVIRYPSNVPVGTVIKIPKLDPSLIDGNNPECIRKARELDDLYLGN